VGLLLSLPFLAFSYSFFSLIGDIELACSSYGRRVRGQMRRQAKTVCLFLNIFLPLEPLLASSIRILTPFPCKTSAPEGCGRIQASYLRGFDFVNILTEGSMQDVTVARLLSRGVQTPLPLLLNVTYCVRVSLRPEAKSEGDRG
jgi:hypothetical protein